MSSGSGDDHDGDYTVTLAQLKRHRRETMHDRFQDIPHVLSHCIKDCVANEELRDAWLLLLAGREAEQWVIKRFLQSPSVPLDGLMRALDSVPDRRPIGEWEADLAVWRGKRKRDEGEMK